MRLEYNILWIEDEIQDYIDIGEVDSLKKFIIELGFTPHIETVNDESKLDDYINLYRYDLIISDFNLSSTTGDKVIEEIRNNKGLDTEILFYTGKDDPEVLKRVAFHDRVSFHVGRNSLIDKIENLIRLTLVRLLDINATRGLITAETSELDVEIETAFNRIIVDLSNDDQSAEKLERIFKKDYKDIQKSYLKRCREKRDLHLVNFRKYFEKSDAYRRWMLLKKLIKLKTPEGFNLDLFRKYSSEVIDIRNKFAHAKAEVHNEKFVLKGLKEDFEYDEKACIEIRKNLISHRENIKKLNS